MGTILLTIAVMLFGIALYLLNEKLKKYISDSKSLIDYIERSNIINKEHFDKEIKHINSKIDSNNNSYKMELDYYTVMTFIKNPPKYKIGQKHPKGFIITDINYIEGCATPTIYLYDGYSLKTGKRTSAEEEL